MLSDTKKLIECLPLLSRQVAHQVWQMPVAVPISEETRTALALSAGIRDVVESDNIAALFTGAGFIVHDPESLARRVRLIGFADARCRKVLASWLSSNPQVVASLCAPCGIRSISRSVRINRLFRLAINYAQKI